MTMLSRVLGFLRDIVIARLLGGSYAADAFFVAFRIPNFFRRLFAEGAFSQAFVPVLAEYRSQRPHREVKDLADRVAGTLAGLLLPATMLAALAAPVFVMIFAPGYSAQPDKAAITAEMLRITFPYLLFISLTALAGSILNTYGRFAVPALTPVFLNLCLIGAAFWLAPHLRQPALALAWGVFIGGLAQVAFQLPHLLRLDLLPRPRFDLRDPGVRRILKLMGPAVFGASVAQVNLMFDTLMASFLQTGSVSWLYYSDRLLELPLGVFGVALATVMLPNLSARHAAGSAARFSQLIDWALRWVFVATVPAAIGLTVLAGPILTTLFQYGRMSGFDVAMATRSLTVYAPGLVAFSLIKVFVPAYYSRHDARTPVRIGIAAMLSNMVMTLLFIAPLKHAGLALATSASGVINAVLLYRGLRRAGVYRPGAGWGRLGRQLLLAGGAMTAVLLAVRGDPAHWLAWNAWDRAARLGWRIVLAAAVYGATLWLAGLRPKDMTVSSGPV